MIYRNIIKTYTFVMKKIFFIITFTIILTNFVTAQNKNDQVKFPLKKSDYITNVKKKVDSSWTYGKDEINFNDYSERIIKAEEERTKSYIANLKATLPETAFLLDPGAFWLSSIIILVTGTMFVMWLGEKITDRGIGNGISLLIMIGIIAGLPQSLMQEFVSALGSAGGGLVIFLVEMLALLFVI